ncbi:sugar ABC transporter permease [Bifidobacterium psychraerophilum]|jgi:multiple sugar transport system permease protein|uniref:Sugar ABC transporter, permease n=1 Tax=Bifidobacterium psychraerophilum TaxID=218140 RepID=A0A087CLQ8_9BIFI|nr:sugar ABC transporter permease [Bifidobacterium psychraerophilum]KFI84208.1 sugar ABC transporter, permease [Bifidobacterium psychraerophilum]MCI1659876.1 sugar ABC transporter permease [Bifidobacterium psychraerophilum]MCI1805217.1 sugar ABC transporter permease [Bifidobacterium psychraerophilum]MCI2177283.1 sugar ABC transporter permease [Bifidobacterium psychraerophilum]MCI2182434.1 sugar ABC transporter permease [Bifidobacterium psychraerophilum]
MNQTKALRGKRKHYGKENLWGWIFTAPFAVVFVVFLVIPLVYAFYMSLFTYTQISGERFSGIANYVRVLTDEAFGKGLLLVVLYTIVMVPIQLGLALGLALLLDSFKKKFASVSRVVIFLPYAIPAVIGALMWGFMYSKLMGPFTTIFSLFGVQAPDFLSSNGIFGSLVNVVTWQWTGYYMIILYSALQSIPTELYESARIDGASELKIATRIKIPLVTGSLIMCTIFSLIGTLQFFTEPTILRNQAPTVIPSEYTPNMYAQALAFGYNQTNYSATVSFSLGLIVVIFSIIFMRLTRRSNGLGD